MAALEHGSFLEKLNEKFRVFLVNRYADPRLGFEGDAALRVFMPDLHWISADRAEKYPDYHFDGAALFQDLFRIVKDVPNLEVFQTGDRLDFWRMGDPDETPDEIYDHIFQDQEITDMNQALADTAATIVHGNHDSPLEDLVSHSANAIREDRHVAADGKIFLTHGHIWDQLEKLPDKLQWGFVLNAERHHAGTYAVGPFAQDPEQSVSRQLLLRRGTLDRDRPIILPRRTGAVPLSKESEVAAIRFPHVPVDRFDDGITTGINDFEKTSGIVSFGDAVRAEARTQGSACRLFVIAHTHCPRILVDRHPAGGGPLVTMDCGAWIENSTIQGSLPHPSHTLGVQSGNDTRVYQLAAR